MTNKEKYRRTFSVLHTSGDYQIEEGKEMSRKNKLHISGLAAAIALVIVMAGTGTAAYAANLGEIQRIIQLWIHGDQTDAVIEIEDGTYNLTYEDADGNTVERGGGGVAFDIFGNERPLTEEELMEELYSPDIVNEDDGTVWVYWFDQKVEITDKFDEDGVCYVTLVHADKPLYLTITKENGYASSPDKYVDPKTFHTSPE